MPRRLGGRPASTPSTESHSNKESPSSTEANRPRNHLITDATTPFTFQFQRFGSKLSLSVNQAADEDTWPGGALWDLGVLLSQVLIVLTQGASLDHIKSSANPVPHRLIQCIPEIRWKDISVLELGCGVGLTGLVASALGARATLLTDLEVVIDRVTKPNVDRNTLAGSNRSCGYRVMKSGGRVTALPLCWGNPRDELAALACLQRMATTSKFRHAIGKGRNKRATGSSEPSEQPDFPSLIIIGDVAYQHKPGAPSHFDALRSTLLNLMDDRTLVLFGTRMRMPASADLLAMFHEDMEELLVPPLEADELDLSFRTDQLGRKHNMTIHFLRKR